MIHTFVATVRLEIRLKEETIKELRLNGWIPIDDILYDTVKDALQGDTEITLEAILDHYEDYA